MKKRQATILQCHDILVQVLTFVSGCDWCHIQQASRTCREITIGSTKFIATSWKASVKSIGQQSLHSLLEERELFTIFLYLTNEPSLDHQRVDEHHRSLLDLAVEMNLFHFARLLVSRGFKSCVDAETMFQCIQHRNLVGCEVLLSCGLPIDRFRSRDDGLNVLTCSVLYGSPELVELFLDHGVSVPNGVLVEGIQSRNTDFDVIEITRLLLEKGACNPSSVSITGVPALQVAVQYSPFAHQLAEVLIEHGADPNQRDGSEGGGFTALDVACKKRKKTCYELLKRKGGTHSLKFAVETGAVSTIESLLSCPARALVPIEDLHYLVTVAAAMGRVESLKVLIDSGRVNDLNEILVRDDVTPLHLVACRGHYSACRLLINSGINVSARAYGGVDLHMFASTLAGSPLWFDPADSGPGGSVVPPPVRLKTAAELAREAGHDRLGKLIDFCVLERVIARRDSDVSWTSSSGGHASPTSVASVSSAHSPVVQAATSVLVLEGL